MEVTEHSLSSRKVPWLVGAVALIVYLLTLNPWISLQSVGIVARLSGWLWRPGVNEPVTVAVLYPLSLLPASWVPVALNLFTVLCAAIVLVLLARSVVLLPQDLAAGQRLTGAIPGAWVAPVLAAALCGLQLTFWEHATSATGEMINLLLFAYVIRCLLEFRIDRKHSWLYQATAVFGAGMANNWAMLGCLPLFIIAVWRVKGHSPFFNGRFLLRMSLWAFVGLSFYLLLPMLHSLSSTAELDFWTTFKLHLKFQLAALASLRSPTFRTLVAAQLLPILLLSIRWKSHTIQLADDTRLGVWLTKVSVHFVHLLCMFIALWVALDPSFSPRNLNLGTSMLTSYYLSALVFGYCAGYFLLLGSVPGDPSSVRRRSRRSRVPRPLRLSVAWIRAGLRSSPYALLLVVPLLLVGRNLSSVRWTNGPMLRDYANQIYADLPLKCVVLSDASTSLHLLEAQLAEHRHKSALLLDTAVLPFTGYRQFVSLKFHWPWPELKSERPPDLVASFAQAEPVVYLEPGLTPVFESFVDEPHGTLHYLSPLPAPRSNLQSPNSLPNQQLWQQRWTNYLCVLAQSDHKRTRAPNLCAWWLLHCLQLAPNANPTLSFLCSTYSRTLNELGVNLQQLGRWSEAQVWFQRALQLNTENLAAQINLAYNEKYSAGEPGRLNPVSLKREFADLFSKYTRWGQVLACDGPVDEPSFLFTTGHTFLRAGSPRQAARAFTRCAELSPQWLAPKLWLAESFLRLQDFDRALELTHAIEISSQSSDAASLAQLLYCQATALRGLGRTNEAAQCLEQFAARASNRQDVLAQISELFAQDSQTEEQLLVLQKLLAHEPDRPDLLKKKGLAQLRAKDYDAAISSLNRALVLSPSDNEARLARASAYFEAGQFDAASADYQPLLNAPNESRTALFGLASIAWRRQDTNAAIDFYRRYLTRAVPQSRQYAIASERLRQLTGQ